MATVGNLGGNIGTHAGLFDDYFGSRATLLVASAMGASSWALLWGCLNFDWSVGLWLLCIIAFVQGQAQNWADLAVVPLGGKNFPQQRGAVIGSLKAFVGFSGAIVTQIYVAFFKPGGHIISFLLLLAFLFGSVTLCAVRFVRCEPSDIQHQRPFSVATCFVVAFGSVLAVSAICEAQLDDFPQWAAIASSVMMLLILGSLVSYFATRSDEGAVEAASNGSSGMRSPEMMHEPLVKDDHASQVDHEAGNDPDEGASTGGSMSSEAYSSEFPDKSLWQALLCVDFWLHFITVWTGCGAGLMLINNVSQIHIAQGGEKGGGDVFVALLSVCSGLGRLFVGIASDRYKTRRPFFVSGAVAAIALGVLLALAHDEAALYMACILAGLGFGAINCLNATVVSEYFGLSAFGSIYSTASIALACGSFTIASYLVGQVYDPLKPDNADTLCHGKLTQESCVAVRVENGRCFFDKDAKGSSQQTACSWSCTGAECFGTAFIVASLLACLGVFTSILVALRNRKRYLALYG